MNHAEEIRMGEELVDYDLIIVHYYNENIQGKEDVTKYMNAYRNAIVGYREEVQQRVGSGREPMRRVRFAECNFSHESHKVFLLEPEKIVYPNIIMYLQGQIHAFNPFAQFFETEEELTNFLIKEFVKETNYHV